MFSWRNATFILLSTLVLQTAILIHLYYNAVFPVLDGEFPTETLLLFNSYDTNADGFVDIWEFEAVKQRISETYAQPEGNLLINDNDIEKTFEDLKITNGEILDIKTEFTPLDLTSMSKFREDQTLHGDMQALTGLRRWQSVVKEETGFAVEKFSCFLPKRKDINLGEPWIFVAPNMSRFGPGLSSNRYFPPSVNTNHLSLQYLLQMFHPRPFLYTRFPPQGAVACVRAENKKFLEIEFRLHAEFQLNTLPLLPFWFSPAQFSGRIIIAKDGSHIEHFEMEVPCNQSLNVDMEWLTGRTDNNEDSSKDASGGNVAPKKEDGNAPPNMEVDIGYLPKMKLKSIAPSYSHADDISARPEEKDIKWEREISREEALTILEQKMYPFKKVPYLSFDKAYTKAKEEKKLVHSILLWGALDDQSC